MLGVDCDDSSDVGLDLWSGFDFLQNIKSPDTTAVQARGEKDIQGIPWDRLNFTREKYRETRLQQYKNYENLPWRRCNLDKVRICNFGQTLCLVVQFVFQSFLWTRSSSLICLKAVTHCHVLLWLPMWFSFSGKSARILKGDAVFMIFATTLDLSRPLWIFYKT